MIDVIIPIYNGYEETRECVESLLKSKNTVEHHFIFINDQSPNQSILELLNSIDDDRVTLLNNENNLGFVKTVNRGMRASENDVILLNSDTVVTENWIDKMYNAAYSDGKVGTVTALTNNGTIASVPYFNQDNELPEGYTIEEFADLVERVSERVYPTIPTAVGHAMYIKRSVINESGFFDEDSFGMGYGEEMDFSCRLIRKGYKNILADDTFIFHYGSTSFKDEKAQLISENKKKLLKNHWWYPINVRVFLYFNKKVKNICKRIQKEM
ncbi:glycosyltransferase family 2 protein [Bacillus thuringiensis]|uniref:Glycosyl transferase family 2 n=1 Tax=Bacillus thuringiensis subsp. darmstadiensis TaxID=132264 RepID=A0A9X6FXX4_BACUD|nr:glycosyltransferase family 2 protein [Bacillus thuringiensis]ADH09680.1 Glycosyl transferase, family 2 [Bacillus thuringiensis BMB171]MDA2637649.1 glycosyltransferase family 2 protein [Bacillus cereus]OTZ28875.1 glycosyl transferase family 2 [Bacillus thuringiensis serovar darmstadiensis]HDR6291346.1 glycosyltransferase family 2 protein [Bacillus cereus]